jgi:hypothetical protein
MYNQAYQQAQQNMYGTANNMAGLGINNSQSNANRDLSAQTSNAANQLAAQTFNATLGLQNNQQAMQLAQQQLSNRTAGLNALGIGNSLQDQNYQQRLGLLNAADQYNWNSLNNYSSIVQNGARLGGTATTSQPNYTNPMSGALGGALAGAQLAGMTGMMGSGAGAGIGALLGLLSDRRFKTDIERVGTLDNGLAVYRYRYKSGGPMQLGVMADEVKAINPDAVITVDGVDYVNYGRI